MIAPTNEMSNYTQLSFPSRPRSRNRGSRQPRSLTIAILCSIMLFTKSADSASDGNSAKKNFPSNADTKLWCTAKCRGHHGYTFDEKPVGLSVDDVNNKVIVTKVRNQARLRGIVPGSQLLSVDDLQWDVMDPLAFTKTSVTQYVKTAQLPIKMSFKCPLKEMFETIKRVIASMRTFENLKKKSVSPLRRWSTSRKLESLRSGTTDRLLEHWEKYGRVFVQTAKAKQVKDDVTSDSVKFLIDLMRMKDKVRPPSEKQPVTSSPGQYIRLLKQRYPEILDTFHFPSNADTKLWCTAKLRETPQCQRMW